MFEFEMKCGIAEPTWHLLTFTSVRSNTLQADPEGMLLQLLQK